MNNDSFFAPRRTKVIRILNPGPEHYEEINRLWAATDLPALVWDTPNWRDGWRVMTDWICRYDPSAAERCHVGSPFPDAKWANEVHIFSHVACGPGHGHTVRHLAIEEEGARLILEWWKQHQQQKAKL